MNRLSQHGASRMLLVSSLRGRGRDLLAWAVWSAVEAVPAFVSGRLIALAVDDGFLHHDTPAGLGYLALLGVSVLIGAWGTREAFRHLAAVVEPFRDELVRRTVRAALHPVALSAAGPDSTVVARLTQQVEIVREAYASGLMVAQGFLMTSVAAFIGLLTLVPAAAVLVAGPLVLGVIVFASVVRPMASVQRASILADERISQSASAAFGGLRDVVACGAEDAIDAAIGARVAERASATIQLARYTAIRSLAITLGGVLPVVLILLRTPWLMRHGVSTGAILGALTYVLSAVHPALQTFIRNVGNTGLWLLVTMRRIVEATDTPELSASGPPLMPESDGGVRLEDVTFAYGTEAEPVFAGFQLEVAPGDHLAIVGPSGAGKSTLANLITGILIPQSGLVTYGRTPAAKLDPSTLAAHRTLVPQEAYLFSATVRENLLYLREDASDADIDNAVTELGAGPLVSRLGGYDAELRIAELSAGERQLLTLIRAYLSPARLVILDEATCHLDPSTEARAEAAFVKRGDTLVVIAHRISSALRARHILVVDGNEAALGTHDELVASSQLYRDLVGHWGPAAQPRALAPFAG
jgi:ATP-binding cassette subfamily C protein